MLKYAYLLPSLIFIAVPRASFSDITPVKIPVREIENTFNSAIEDAARLGTAEGLEFLKESLFAINQPEIVEKTLKELAKRGSNEDFIPMLIEYFELITQKPELSDEKKARLVQKALDASFFSSKNPVALFGALHGFESPYASVAEDAATRFDLHMKTLGNPELAVILRNDAAFFTKILFQLSQNFLAQKNRKFCAEAIISVYDETLKRNKVNPAILTLMVQLLSSSFEDPELNSFSTRIAESVYGYLNFNQAMLKPAILEMTLKEAIKSDSPWKKQALEHIIHDLPIYLEAYEKETFRAAFVNPELAVALCKSKSIINASTVTQTINDKSKASIKNRSQVQEILIANFHFSHSEPDPSIKAILSTQLAELKNAKNWKETDKIMAAIFNLDTSGENSLKIISYLSTFYEENNANFNNNLDRIANSRTLKTPFPSELFGLNPNRCTLEEFIVLNPKILEKAVIDAKRALHLPAPNEALGSHAFSKDDLPGDVRGKSAPN